MLLYKGINQDFINGNSVQGIEKLSAEDNNGSKAALFEWYMDLENWAQVQEQLDDLDLNHNETIMFKDAAQAILSAHFDQRWPCLVTEEEKSLLIAIVDESNPGDAAHGIAKGALRELNNLEDYLLLPEFVPKGAPRSLNYQSLIELFSVYPNPAANYFLIDAPMEKDEIAEIKLFDSSGKVVLDQKFNSYFGPGLINVDHLAAGVYAFSVSCPDIGIQTGNILIRK